MNVQESVFKKVFFLYYYLKNANVIVSLFLPDRQVLVEHVHS